MKITNDQKLPEPLVRAVTRHPRERIPKRISVTELIQPPQLRALTIRHEADLTEDASNRIWSLLGTLLHGVLERNAQGLKDTITEEELTMEIDGWTVVGHYDLSEMILEDELLTDWKLTSVWAVLHGIKTEWESQLNTYAQLIRHAKRQVSQLQIVAIARDWQQSRAKREPDYPQQQVKVMAVPLWTPEETLEFIKERIALHQAAENGIWPDCTAEERWAKSDQWAVMKKGQKKAVKLYNSQHSAEFAVAKDQYVQHRPGESTRCESYCAVSKFCEQFNREKTTLTQQLEGSLALLNTK